ncbi:MAG: hypothetical protein ABI855_08025 [Bacteroidota bacterium]
MKKILLLSIVLMFLYSTSLFAQSAADSSYNKQIAAIESKISELKNLPKDEQKKHYSVLSDVENRKNTLKSLLKTPVGKRNKAWEDSWNQNYSKASGKLENIQTK